MLFQKLLKKRSVANRIFIKHNSNWGLDEELVKKYALKALRTRNLDEIELSIRFVGRRVAKELNQKYRKMNYIPQVLGFPMSKKKEVDGWTHLGDIVICNEKLKYEARFQQKTISEILEFWLLHGVDNLL